MLEKCEFCEKWDFENVNFVKIEILKMWILWKLRFWKCEFCEKVGLSKCEISDKMFLKSILWHLSIQSKTHEIE